MNHEYVDKLCLHCGLPRKRADRKGCPVNRYGEPAKRALAAIGLVYVGFETNGMYANYQDPLSRGFCGRMFWPQITAILEIMHDPWWTRQRQESCKHTPIAKSMDGEMWCLVCGKDLPGEVER